MSGRIKHRCRENEETAMKKNYASLTGEDVVRCVRKKNQQKRLLCMLGILLAAAGIVGVFLWILRMHEFFYGILLLLLLCFVVYALFTGISNAGKVLKNVERSRLFRKFGTPEAIAARVAAECGEPLLDSKGTLICNSFIMKHGDFESFIPFEKALHVYRREHRTNGIQDGVYLVVCDVYGDKQDYSFKFGKKGKLQMQEIIEHILQQAPDCAAGYSKEAIAYAKQKVQKLPEE